MVKPHTVAVPAIGSTSPKWSDRRWALAQLQAHLVEVRELLEADDPHFNKELADLTMIATHLVSQSNLDERFKKFAAKGQNEGGVIS